MKVDGRKSHAELRPDVVAMAKQLARKKPKGGKLSLRAIAAELVEALGHLNERGKPVRGDRDLTDAGVVRARRAINGGWMIRAASALGALRLVRQSC